MDGKDFINVAAELANANTEAHWRSAISRAYYAAFHVAKKAVIKKGGRVPRSGIAHRVVKDWLVGHPNQDITAAGSKLGNLHMIRKNSDYDVSPETICQDDAKLELTKAKDIILSIQKHL